MESLRRGEAAVARGRFSTGAKLSATPLPFRLGVAYADLLAGRLGPARTLLETILLEAPHYVPALEALADLDAFEGRERNALDGYRTLLRLFPGDERMRSREESVRCSLVERRSAEAEAALEARDLSAARREALALVEIDPSSPSGYRFLARAAEADGRLEDAWTAASKAQAVDPTDETWSKVTVELAMKTGRYAEAVSLYSDLARRDPSFASSLEEAQLQFQVQTLPDVARRAALASKVTRAQFAALAWWLVPEVREARVPAAPDVAVDAIERPESQELVRAIALGFFAVARDTHRVGADQPVSRTEAAVLFRRVGLLAGGRGLPECLAEERPSATSLSKCGILPATSSRTLTGREAVRGLMAAARAGRGGDGR
jgi:tetratricopeptide (TPR) repeat protein